MFTVKSGMLKRPCHFYNTTGKCRFGKHCKFLHEVFSDQNPISQQDHNESVNTSDQKLQEVIEDQQPIFNQQDNDGALNRSSDTTVEREAATNINSADDTDKVQHGSLNRQGRSHHSSSIKKGSCRFYFKNGYCHFGSRCRFSHSRHHLEKASDDKENTVKPVEHGADQMQDEAVEYAVKEPSENDAAVEISAESTPNWEGSRKTGKNASEVEGNPHLQKVCRFYKQGYCRYGKRCKLLHPRREPKNKIGSQITNAVTKLSVNDGKAESTADEKLKKPQPVLPASIKVFNREELTHEKIKEVRDAEICQLKRRFPNDRIRAVEEGEENASFVFTFCPTDPDWPYDVKSFDIQIIFPVEYPLKLFELTLPFEQDLPETVRRYVEVSLEEWTEKTQKDSEAKGTAENYLRPFMRWLEKNILDMVTDGLRQLRRELTAKAAGIQFISSQELQKKVLKTTEETGSQSVGEADNSTQLQPEGVIYRKSEQEPEETYECPTRSEAYSGSEEDEEEEEEETGEEEEGAEGHQRPQIAMETERRGTELSFGNMKMWFCTTVMMEKLRLSVRCDRCKHETDFSTPPNRINSIICGKCSNDQLVGFRPVLAHTYSSTFGYLDLEGCSVYDVILQDCQMSIGCIMCSRDVLIKKFCPGVQTEIYCRGCHTKMKFACENVKINLLTAAGVDKAKFSGAVHQVASKLVRRVPNDPAIKEGKPLPDNGSCKHYKKSFRWLRFPCCGKCYPCDLCHDDKEDHEMKFANRMVCGFCCREQPFAADKPCVGCSSALTKVRTSHWEGGRGCRDKITMSRFDEKKYTNLNKTVSKKAQAIKENTKGAKKNTKLRHT